MSTLEEVRARPFDTAADGQSPAFMHVRTPFGTMKVGISRENAAAFLDSALFTGALVVISLSGWRGTEKRRFEEAEALAVLHQLLGPAVLPKLRTATLGGGAMYFVGLTDGDEFVSPTMLQDAALARRYRSSPAIPAGWTIPPPSPHLRAVL